LQSSNELSTSGLGEIVMVLRFLPICAAGILLTGCAAESGPSLSASAGQGNVVHGYMYQDANHPNGLSQSSPQADYNATHGTWLWPPAAFSDKPN
jgi:hypothetical protein